MIDDEKENESESSEASGQDAADEVFGSFDQPNNPEAGRDDLTGVPSSGRSRIEELDAVYDVPVQISAVLGRAVMPVNNLLKLGRGAVVQLDKRVGEAIEIFVNNKLVARGEVVVVDERLGITMTEIIKSDRSS